MSDPVPMDLDERCEECGEHLERVPPESSTNPHGYPWVLCPGCPRPVRVER